MFSAHSIVIELSSLSILFYKKFLLNDEWYILMKPVRNMSRVILLKSINELFLANTLNLLITMGCGSSTCMSNTQTELDIRGKGNLLSTQEFPYARTTKRS